MIPHGRELKIAFLQIVNDLSQLHFNRLPPEQVLFQTTVGFFKLACTFRHNLLKFLDP